MSEINDGYGLLPELPFRDGQDRIICPRCGMTSYNPGDIKNKYCGNCHLFHDQIEEENETAVSRGSQAR